MTKSSIVWGAGLACALGGAVAGTALGSTPILDRPSIGSFYQAHERGESAPSAEARVLPDHYPLVTRNGTVPVAALSERGLFRQARYRALYGEPYESADFDHAAYDPGNDDRFAASDASLSIGDPAPPPAPEGTAPLELAAGPTGLTAAGQAKTIDVKAALAMR